MAFVILPFPVNVDLEDVYMPKYNTKPPRLGKSCGFFSESVLIFNMARIVAKIFIKSRLTCILFCNSVNICKLSQLKNMISGKK